ncbi:MULTISPECIES: hypothetical protein [Streptosporangium]|nr:hypothetical protein [Streptosporangium minutum]
MAENLPPESELPTPGTDEEHVPFTVEMMELDSNPIILQPKSY